MAKTLLADIETGEIFPVEEQKVKPFRTQHNYKLGDFPGDLEVTSKETQTVPDLSYTIKEILDKYTRGLPLDLAQKGEYDNISDFDGNEEENPIDITEVTEVLTAVNSRLAKSAQKKGGSEGEKGAPDITEKDKAPTT